jgi:hypothetical protein
MAGATFVSPAARASVLAALDDRAAAVAALAEAVQRRDAGVLAAGVDPVYAPLRTEPAFLSLWARVGPRASD